MFGIFAVALLMFTAPVSFASDGPETTKDCVIDTVSVMETLVAFDEVKDLSVKTIPLGVKTSYLIVESNETYDKEYEFIFPAKNIETTQLIHIDPGVTNLTSYNYNNLKCKTSIALFTYDNSNCLCRYLRKS